uniref:Uncharacterized protein n=1 Tax=mine drainage metagenome TaxID=410659 RepID=E6PYE2_9ZZZZ
MNVDAVEQRAGDFGDVALDHGRGTHAFAGLVVEVSAGAWVHGGGEHKARGKGERHAGAGDGDGVFLEGLAHDFQDVAGKLGKLVEKKQAVVGERDLTGAGNGTAADESGVGDGVVRGAEWTLGNESRGGVEDASDGVDLGSFEGLVEGKRGEDGREALGEHGFAGAGWADHKDVVSTRGGDFKSALGGLLSAYVAEVGGVVLQLGQEHAGGDLETWPLDFAKERGVEQVDDVGEVFDGVDVDALDDSGLGSIDGWDDEICDAARTSQDGDGEDAGDGTQSAVEAEFADEEKAAEVFEV